MEIRWNKSDDGFISSKCGKYEIRPNFWGRCNPLNYTLYRGTEKLTTEETQKECKNYLKFKSLD